MIGLGSDKKRMLMWWLVSTPNELCLKTRKIPKVWVSNPISERCCSTWCKPKGRRFWWNRSISKGFGQSWNVQMNLKTQFNLSNWSKWLRGAQNGAIAARLSAENGENNEQENPEFYRYWAEVINSIFTPLGVNKVVGWKPSLVV